MACAFSIEIAAAELRDAVAPLRFGVPVAHVYNPLAYAWEPYRAYLRRWGRGRRRVVFLGLNPGPWGMAQVGVPFGETSIVRDWLGITGAVSRPEREHPAKPVLGFDCKRSEVSGRRLWGLFAERFGSAEAFFSDHIVLNYCPLLLLDEGGRNVTPDRLRDDASSDLFAACDAHLHAVVDALRPEWVVGIGRFASRRAALVLGEGVARLGEVPHPSPASPAANRGWASAATERLEAQGVWATGGRKQRMAH